MPLMAGRIVEYEEALGPALGEALKNVDCLIDLSEKIIGIEENHRDFFLP